VQRPRRTTIHDFIFGRRLRSEEAKTRQVGVLTGIPFLGLDALASAAYGPEAALTVLLPLGAAGLRYIAPMVLLILVLLVIVQASYRQIIAAYPDDGGSYTVAKANLGIWPGLLAGAALWIDYILNVAVAISAGVGALVSAVPALLPHTLPVCMGILVLLTLVNLRGVRDSGVAFMAPTYLFILCLAAVVLLGVGRFIAAGGHPQPLAPSPPLAPGVTAAGAWLLLRAFASGCTAMTGIEAVSNAVPVFREPRVRHAQRTLAAIVAILAYLLIGIALLTSGYKIGATEPGRPGYQSVLSQIVGAVAGRGSFYYLAMATIVAVLCLSANTSFAGFPRLCRLLAVDRFLPAAFADQGSRLVFVPGIVLLALLAGALLAAFGGTTDRLIPLFAVGAFLAFTLSQLGMVAHWRKQPAGTRRRRGAVAVNALGAAVTGVTLVVVLTSKWAAGAWITVLLLGSLLLVFHRVKAHLTALEREIVSPEPLDAAPPQQPMVLLPMKRFDRVSRKALRFALALSGDIVVVQLLSSRRGEEDLSATWTSRVESPCRAAGLPVPRLIVLRSPFREVLEPLLSHVQRMTFVHPHRLLAVVVPEVVTRRWYHFFLRNHTAMFLKTLLLLRGGPEVVVVSVPWHPGQDKDKDKDKDKGTDFSDRRTS
jgi:amino acid transporter